MKPQKHAAVIKAWADGATIQHRFVGSKNWITWSHKINSPNWLDDTEYRASIAEVEGKPVFIGDVLNCDGRMLPLISVDGDIFVFDCGHKYRAYPNRKFVSWNPPKPKTFMLNGVELPMPDGSNFVMTITAHADMGGCVNKFFQWEKQSDRDKVEKAIINLLEGK